MSYLCLCTAKLHEKAATAAPAFLLAFQSSLHMQGEGIQDQKHLKGVICTESSLQLWPVVLGSWAGQREIGLSGVLCLQKHGAIPPLLPSAIKAV